MTDFVAMNAKTIIICQNLYMNNIMMVAIIDWLVIPEVQSDLLAVTNQVIM